MLEDLLTAIVAWLIIGLLIAVARWLFQSVVLMLVLNLFQWDAPWAAFLPIGREYAVVATALGEQKEMYVFGITIPAGLARWNALAAIGLAIVPIVGWIAALVLYFGCCGPSYAWIFASMEQRPLRETQLKGYVAAVFPLVGTIMLLISYLKCR